MTPSCPTIRSSDLAQPVAQRVQKAGPGVDAELAALAVDLQGHGDGGPRIWRGHRANSGSAGWGRCAQNRPWRNIVPAPEPAGRGPGWDGEARSKRAENGRRGPWPEQDPMRGGR